MEDVLSDPYGIESWASESPMTTKTEAVRHVFFNEVTDWFIAESGEEAQALCRQYHIDNKTGCDEDEMGLDFWQEDDDKIIGIVPDEDQSLPAVKKTCRAWAMDNGKGFLCSTEY